MKRSEIILMVLQVPIDFLMLILAGVSAYYLRFSHYLVNLKPVIFKFGIFYFLNIVSLVGLGWLLIFALLGLYSTNPNRKLMRDIARVILACAAGLAAVAVYIMFTQQQFDSRFLVAAAWAFAVIYVIFGRILMRGVKGLLYRAGWGLRRVAVIGFENSTEEIINILKQRKALGYKVVGQFPKFTEELEQKLRALKLDEIIFTNPKADEVEALTLIQFSNDQHLVLKYSADLFTTYSSNMAVSTLAGVPIIELRRTPLDGWGRVAKRIFDIIASVAVIVIMSPVMVLTGLIILLETGRPIIYKNERVGIRGKKFFTYKFRSMYKKDCTGVQFGRAGVQAEAKEKTLIAERSIKEGPVYKIANDPRVTPFGRFIRRWSIDEIPQFFNVLGGTMSIVGPRPHQPREVDKYEKHHRQVLTLKPGITGLAQISGRSDLQFEEEIKLDVFYIEKWSLLQDAVIFIKTPFVVLKRRGAL